jgi:hypothetical protein
VREKGAFIFITIELGAMRGYRWRGMVWASIFITIRLCAIVRGIEGEDWRSSRGL